MQERNKAGMPVVNRFLPKFGFSVNVRWIYDLQPRPNCFVVLLVSQPGTNFKHVQRFVNMDDGWPIADYKFTTCLPSVKVTAKIWLNYWWKKYNATNMCFMYRSFLFVLNIEKKSDIIGFVFRLQLYAEKVAQRGLCAIAQCESLRYKLIGGLAVRRWVLYNYILYCIFVGKWEKKNHNQFLVKKKLLFLICQFF